MKTIKLLFPLCLLFLLYSEGQGQSQKPVVEIIDGIEHVHNPAEPLYPGKTVILEEEITFNGEDKNGNLIVYKIERFKVYNSGNIYFYDSPDRQIKVFDSNGKFIRIIGRKGRGPGEIEQTTGFDLTPSGKLVCLDFGNYRTSFFDPDGKYINSHRWDKARYGLFYVSDSLYITKVSINQGYRHEVKAISISGNKLNKLFEYVNFKRHITPSINIGIPYSPSSKLAADIRGSRLYHTVDTKYTIDMWDIGGRLIRKIDRPYKPVVLNKKFKDEFWSDAIGELKDGQKERLNQIKNEIPWPKHLPAVQQMFVDENGNLWAETFEYRAVDNKKQTAFDIYNDKGYYDSRVWLGLPSQSKKLIKNGKLYCLYTDEETGLKLVRRYNIKWSKK